MSNAPAYKATIGKITVTVWRNTTQEGTVIHNIDFTRSYRDKNDEWKNGTSFNHADLLNVARLAERAEAFIHNDKANS